MKVERILRGVIKNIALAVAGYLLQFAFPQTHNVFKALSTVFSRYAFPSLGFFLTMRLARELLNRRLNKIFYKSAIEDACKDFYAKINGLNLQDRSLDLNEYRNNSGTLCFSIAKTATETVMTIKIFDATKAKGIKA